MSINKLEKNSLTITETIALSVAIMGPSASISMVVMMMSFTTAYSAPLVIVISMICIGLVSISVIKLNQFFPSAGSVYYFAEKTLGRRVGFVSGWLIVFTYLTLGVSCTAVASSNLQLILSALSIKIHWEVIAILFLVLIWFLAGKDAKMSVKMMLLLEAVAISIILVLSILIILKVATTTGLSVSPFMPGENSLSSISYAAVFGFLAFAGFEGASSLGEESKNPQKSIPIAVASAVIICGVFYIVVAYAQVIGFGMNPSGLANLTSSDSPLAELSYKYLSRGFSFVIIICISISFFATTLGCISAGSRILYTMGRDGMLSKEWKTNKITPFVGLNILIAASSLIFLVCYALPVLQVARYAATIGTLTLILSYVLTTACATVFFYKEKNWKGTKLLIPILSLVILVFIFFSNVYPVPEYPMNIVPYCVIGWLVLGLILCMRVKD